jgi:putative ABC transport system permease protein
MTSFLSLVVQRMRSQIGLVLCLLLGILLAVALATAIPVFVNAVQLRVLRTELLAINRSGAGQGDAASLPFALQFSFFPSSGDGLSHATYADLDEFMTSRIEPRTILPRVETVRTAQTAPWRMTTIPGSPTAQRYDNGRPDEAPLALPTVDMLSNIAAHVQIEDGVTLDDAAPVSKDEPVPVLAARAFADKYGVSAGDTFMLNLNVESSGSNPPQATVQLPVRIAGVWLPVNPREDYWGLSPTTLDNALIVTPKAFNERIGPEIGASLRSARWQYVLDASKLTAEGVAPFLARARALQQEAFRENDDILLIAALLDALARYLRTSQELTLLLVIFSVPIFAIMLYFVVLVAGMVVRRQEGEITTLRSRGASTGYIIGLYVAQTMLIVLGALIIGVPLGYGLASVMAGTRTFLQFGPPQPVELALFDADGRFTGVPLPVRFALIAAAVSLLGVLLPAIATSRMSIVALYADRGRNARRPLWQRAFVDVLLLVVALYGLYQLRGQGSIATVGAAGTRSDPLADPVRFLLPVLMLTALGLIVVRLFPLVMALIAKLTERAAPTPVVLAFRELARSPKELTGPLVLLIFTMGIAMYGASIAKTLDEHLATTTFLRVGADARLVEQGESNKITLAPGELAQPGQVISDPDAPEYWTMLPPEGHLDIPGVTGYARAARLPVQARELGGFGVKQIILAIDRRRFQDVASVAYRDELSPQPFGALMNALATSRDSVLVDRGFMGRNNLKIGDQVELVIEPGKLNVPVTYTVRGAFDFFPTVTTGRDDPTAFVTNIGYTFEQLGKDVPYDVLLSLAPGVSGLDVARGATEREYLVNETLDARSQITEAQQQPARQGLFGVLTTGFLAATLLTTVGFVLYSLVSFRRRAIELAVLRTMGLSQNQMAVYLIITQSTLVLLGALAGSLIGALVSRLFIPFLQVGGALVNQVPPFLVRIAWSDLLLLYLAVAVALAVALGFTLLLLRRLKAFEAIKFGMVS